MAAGLQAQPQDCKVNLYIETGLAMPKGMLLDARLEATRAPTPRRSDGYWPLRGARRFSSSNQFSTRFNRVTR